MNECVNHECVYVLLPVKGTLQPQNDVLNVSYLSRVHASTLNIESKNGVKVSENLC